MKGQKINPDTPRSLCGTEDLLSVLQKTNEIFKKQLEARASEMNAHEKEAMQWAQNVPNICHYMYAYQAALTALDAGFSLPHLSSGEQKHFRRKSNSAVACYSPSKDTVYIDERNLLLYDWDEYQITSGWWTQPNTILHELGHAIAEHIGCKCHIRDGQLAKYSKPADWPQNLKTGKPRRNTTAHTLIVQKVSTYAATDWAEFDAEVISGLLAGRKFDKWVIDQLPDFGDVAFRKLKEKGTKK